MNDGKQAQFILKDLRRLPISRYRLLRDNQQRAAVLEAMNRNSNMYEATHLAPEADPIEDVLYEQSY